MAVSASVRARARACVCARVCATGDIPETCPVNLIKAQAMGAIPISSRLPESAIPEIAEQFDLGVIRLLCM